jgi:hypothetical protein
MKLLSSGWPRQVRSIGLFKACLPMLACVLVACSSTLEDQAIVDHERVQLRMAQAHRQLRTPPDAALSAPVVTEKSLRFTRRSVPFDSSQMLPAHVQTVTMRTTGQHSLRSVAEWIERLTRIPVVVSADALMPASAFVLDLPATGVGAAASAPSPATDARTGRGARADPTRQAAQAIEAKGGPRQMASEQDPALFSVDYHGPLPGLLDQVATRASVYWSYQGGAIRFYRAVSRTIAVRTLPGSLSQSGGVQLASGMSTTADMELDIWTAIESTLRQMISRQGRLRVDPALGQVTVRDAVNHVDAVERYVENANRLLTRQVSLGVEVLQVNLNNRFETGIDWNYVRQTTNMGLFTAGTVPSVTGSTANVGFARNNEGAAASTLIVRALESFGRVSTAYSSVINTINRQPVPVGSINTQSYLKQITPTSTTNSSGAIGFGPPGLTPGEISTGFNMTLLPIVLDSNMVLLQFGVSISSLKELATFSSGTGLAQQTLQQPNVNTFQTLQRMAVRSGDTIVLSGFETEMADFKQNDIKRDVLPGSRASNREKTTLVVLITPRLLEF